MSEEIQPNGPLEEDNLTWAEQTYYRAKYGYTRAGVPMAASSEMFRQLGVPGSNIRLQRILEDSRVSVVGRRNSNALIHTGPDGSLIITNESGWGLLYPEQSDIYAELDERYMCHWEISQATWVPEAPYWAICSDY